MNWGKIIKYAAALFAMQFVIGFVEGSFSSTDAGAGVAALVASTAASFAFCGAIFAHLAAHQPFKPFAHAWVALLLQAAVASVLAQALNRWLGQPLPFLFALEWFALVCALVVGGTLGSILRQKSQATG